MVSSSTSTTSEGGDGGGDGGGGGDAEGDGGGRPAGGEDTLNRGVGCRLGKVPSFSHLSNAAASLHALRRLIDFVEQRRLALHTAKPRAPCGIAARHGRKRWRRWRKRASGVVEAVRRRECRAWAAREDGSVGDCGGEEAEEAPSDA